MIERVGVIGLGAMGSVIATHLLDKNFDVSGYDVVSKRCRELVPLGLKAKGSIQDVANHAEIIISSLPSFKSLQTVIDEICMVDKSKQILLETSTLKVSEKIEAGKIFNDKSNMILLKPDSDFFKYFNDTDGVKK